MHVTLLRALDRYMLAGSASFLPVDSDERPVPRTI